MSKLRSSSLRPGRWWRRLFIGLLILASLGVLFVAAVLNYRYGLSTLARISTEYMDVHADFDTFWRSADAFLNGGDVYDAGARLINLNPPVWVLITSPLGTLPPLEAYRVFIGVMIAVMVGALTWMADEARLRVGIALPVIVALLVTSPMLGTLALGQMYPILTLGLVAAWVADRRGWYLSSGLPLGLVVALKPSLAPIVLWPLFRRRWDTFGAAFFSGGAVTLAGSIVLGPQATLDWLEVLREEPLSPYWDNASLPAAAARLFTENPFVDPLATLPWMVPVAFAVGFGLALFTAFKARRGSEWGLWALVAASLLASPIAWHNYLVLLAPGVLLLFSRRRKALALLLLVLQLVPAAWMGLWGDDSVVAALGLTSYLFILAAHWFSFLIASGSTGDAGAEHSTGKGRAGGGHRAGVQETGG